MGTSSLKGLLITKDGKVVATASSDYAVLHPKAGFSEQDPQEWVNAAKNVIRQILIEVPLAKTSIEAISFSGQMHSLVLLDENDRPIRNAILWNDVRTTKQCIYITDKLGEDLVKITKKYSVKGAGLDTPFCLNSSVAAILKNADKTRSITITTDRNAIVVYTSNYFDNKQIINGICSKPYIGIALEAQTLPDAIHHKDFGDVVMRSKIKEYKTIIKMC
ncbi:MAG: hypothetical protein LBT07_02275 [Endomicrobium sp.]|nr:hypothetical protein [Endomicrobium sp.]